MGGCLRSTDTAARLGGDEFAVILELLPRREDGHGVAGKIVAAARAPFPWGRINLAVTASVGIAFYDGTGTIEGGALMQTADEALYHAKASGRDRFQEPVV